MERQVEKHDFLLEFRLFLGLYVFMEMVFSPSLSRYLDNGIRKGSERFCCIVLNMGKIRHEVGSWQSD